jgi:cyclopropane fatty-acyl-phospholipid synthase-like methyltransferase
VSILSKILGRSRAPLPGADPAVEDPTPPVTEPDPTQVAEHDESDAPDAPDAPDAADEPPAPVPQGPGPVIDQTFPVDDVAEYYDAWTERYEAVFGDVFQHLKAADHDQLLGHMAEVAQLADGDRVVDGGCGVCGPARHFARLRDVTIDAVTISQVQVERGRELVAQDGLSGRITVHLGDFHHLDQVVEPGSCDLVYFLEALVHAHDPLEALRSAFRVLAPGGRVYIKDFYRGHSDDPAAQRVIDECVEATNRICHLTIRNTEDMDRWVREAGFEIEVSQPLATQVYSIEDGHEFCRRYGLDVAAGRDFTTTFYLDNLEIRARKPR